MKPLDVSIVIPVHQGERHLPRTLESCVREFDERCRGEIVAVDDQSSDGSLALLRGWGPRVRVLPSAVRLGRNAARNRGLAEAGGVFVKFLDQDDLLEPGSLGEELRLATSERADLVVSSCRIAPLGGGGERVVAPLDPAKGIDALLAGESALTAAVLYRRTYLAGCAWDDDAGKLDDWRFLLEAALKGGRIVARPGIAYTWVQHPDQRSRQHSLVENAREFYRTLDWLEARLLGSDELNPERRRRLAQYRYKELSILGRFDRAAFEIQVQRILGLDPSFRPLDEERRFWMRVLARMIGFRRAIWFYLMLRAVAHGSVRVLGGDA